MEHIISRRSVTNGTKYVMNTGQSVSAEGRTRISGAIGDDSVTMGVVLPPEILRGLAESQGTKEGCAVVNHGGLPAPLRGNTKVEVSISLSPMRSNERRNCRRWIEKTGDAIAWIKSTSLDFGIETLTAIMTVTEYNALRVPAVGPVVSWRDDAKSGAFRSNHISGKKQGKRRTTRGARIPAPKCGKLIEKH